MRVKLLPVLLGVLFLSGLASAPVQANSYNFNVSFTLGGDPITGTITTDTDSPGALFSSDITAWSFNIGGGCCAGYNSISGNPSDTDYQPTNNGTTPLVLVDGGSAINYDYATASTVGIQFANNGLGLNLFTYFNGPGAIQWYWVPLNGSCCQDVTQNTSLGTQFQVATLTATPIPAALPLFATGLGAMGLFGWRRKRKNAAAIAAA
jgi:hypothetical protein